MYNLYFLSNKAKNKIGSHWRIISMKSGEVFEGSLHSVTNYANLFFDITEKEINIALDEMVKTKKDSAHFGYVGRFVYTFDSFEEDTKNGGLKNGIH